MILLIDNYDSFSYNLYQLVGSLEPNIQVTRNDQITVSEIRRLNPTAIIISPGPGRPEDAGAVPQIIDELKSDYPILGVCLGHQCICQAFGTRVTYAKELMHGKQSQALLQEDLLFKNCGHAIPVARYHSLAADATTIPKDLKVIAETDDGEIMAVKHIKYPIYGLQFHPESIMTPMGKIIIKNFMDIVKGKEQKND